MTHSGGKPHSVGDRGRRYEVRATGYPVSGETVIGWSETKEGAYKMAQAIRKAPGCLSTTIFDRHQNMNVITSYARILR